MMIQLGERSFLTHGVASARCGAGLDAGGAPRTVPLPVGVPAAPAAAAGRWRGRLARSAQETSGAVGTELAGGARGRPALCCRQTCV